MRNKIFSLLVLLMTAVSGAVAQSYEAKVFDVPASWTEDNTPLSAADLPEDFVQITKDEAKALAVPDGTVLLIYGFEGDEVKMMQFDSGTFIPEDEESADAVREVRGNFRIFQTEFKAKICYTAPAIPVTDLGNNTWEFTMPDYAVVANIEYDTDLELQEENVNTTVLADWDGYEADVTLTRTLAAGSYNTFAAPFSTAIPEGWTVKELTSATFADGTLTLNFTDAASIEAGKPYLVKVAANTDLSTAPFTGAIVSKEAQPFTSTDVDFIPTLGATTIEGSDTKSVLFLAASNTLLNPSALPADIKGFRAYFQLKGDAASARMFAMDFGEGETTSISEELRMKNEEFAPAAAAYDLQGRRVAQHKKGVYIQNGKKVIIK